VARKLFKTIGLGIAFSPNLKTNLYEASRLTMCFDCKLVLIHVGRESEDKSNTLKTILNTRQAKYSL